MVARLLTSTQIIAWKIAGKTPGKRTELFNAEWESLCELALEALELRAECEALRNELETLKNVS